MERGSASSSLPGLTMTHESAASVLVQHRLLRPEARGSLLGTLSTGLGDLTAAMAELSVDVDEALRVLAQATLRDAERVRLFKVTHDPHALLHLTAGEAWDHLVLPLETETDGTLVCCTTRETLPSTLGFLYRRLKVPFRIVLADIAPLEQYIAEQYHYEGVEVDSEAA